MLIDLAALAESANIATTGNLNILGIFDTIAASTFPCRRPSLAFAFRVLAESEDQEKHFRLQVYLIDQDFQHIWGGAATVNVGRILPGQFRHVNQVISLQDVIFKSPGRYRFRIQVEGQDEPYDTVFQVVPTPAKADADASGR